MEKIPDYAYHSNDKICGFFGLFRFLSNFYPVPNGIYYEDLVYPSVENAYQAAKFPKKDRQDFTSCSSVEAKRLGKKASIDLKQWKSKKYQIMEELVFQKFSYPNFKELLLATENAYLEETNGWGDQDWGCDEHGNGLNNLGKILMSIRNKFKK